MKSGLEVIQGHTNWCHSKAWMMRFCIVTMAVSIAVCETFSVKEWLDLQNQKTRLGVVQGQKMGSFDRPYAIFKLCDVE